MNREIKFRFWDKEEEQMFNEVSVDCDTTINDYINRIRKDYILMQYTGLKDRKGIEIYEGDILKNFGEVYFLAGKFEVGGQINPRCIGGIIIGDLEVIGNIYENKELIASAEANKI